MYDGENDVIQVAATQQGSKTRLGFSLVEALASIAVIAILLAVALPSFLPMKTRAQLKSAAERLRNDLGEARTEALKRNRYIYLSFTRSSATQWCWGFRLDQVCSCAVTDPAAGNVCFVERDASGVPIRRVISSGDYRGIQLDNLPFAGALRFSPVRPEVLAGNATFIAAASGESIRVIASDFGRIRLCSPAGALHVGGLAVCS